MESGRRDGDGGWWAAGSVGVSVAGVISIDALGLALGWRTAGGLVVDAWAGKSGRGQIMGIGRRTGHCLIRARERALCLSPRN